MSKGVESPAHGGGRPLYPAPPFAKGGAGLILKTGLKNL